MGVTSACESEWAAYVLLFKKKDKTQRMVVDERPLNSVTVKDSYPMGNIENMLDSLSGSVFFIGLDLFSDYYNVNIAVKNRHKTAFIVPLAPGFSGGLYQFNRMCFWLTNARATFCRLVDRISGDIKQQFCVLYADDFFIHSRTFEQHLAHLGIVFQRLKDSGLKIKPSRCSFSKSKICLLGTNFPKKVFT